jgi:hypothetical protein
MQQDWFILWAAVDDLEEYLHSNVLHWPLATKKAGVRLGNLPRLTPGILCLSKKRLSVLSEFQVDLIYLETIEKIESILTRWRVAWGKKSSLETHERLRLWHSYMLDEVSQDFSISDYAVQIRTRTILELLKDEVFSENTIDSEHLESLDIILKNVTSAGSFIWDEKYRLAFPENRFWFLYRS